MKITTVFNSAVVGGLLVAALASGDTITQLQTRVAGTCTEPFAIKTVNADGTVVCTSTTASHLATIGTSSSPGALRGLIGTTGQTVSVDSFSVAGDQGGGTFQWDTSSSSGDDGGTIIVPTGSSTGRWKRVIQDGARYNVRWWGAKGDGSTDDTAAIQTALAPFQCPISAMGSSGPLSGQQHELYFPSGCYKVTNPITFEGSTGCGLRMKGESGPPGGVDGTTIAWGSSNSGGTVLQWVGANYGSIDNMRIDPYGNCTSSTGHAQNGFWLDAFPNVTTANYAITSISRSSGIVTATVSSTTGLVSPDMMKVTGVTDASFNGVWRILNLDSTHISWLQNGSSATSSGGNAALYQSADAFSDQFYRVVFTQAQAITTTVSTVSGTFPDFTFTTTTPHYLTVGDLVVYRNGSSTSTNSTYLGWYRVKSITSSTVAVLTNSVGGEVGSPPTGGNLLSGAVGFRIGHSESASSGIGNITGYDLAFTGTPDGLSVAGMESDSAGNTKDFAFYDTSFLNYRYGVVGLNSGYLTFNTGGSALYTPDTQANLACIEFLQDGGQAFISNWESEESNGRLWFSTTAPGAATVHMDAVSWQSGAPTDDIVIAASQLFITDSFISNNRTSTSVPYIQASNPAFGTGTTSIVSYGNTYNNASNPSAPTKGWIPLIDGPGGNPVIPVSGAYATYAMNITSVGDYGSTALNTSAVALNNTVAAVERQCFGAGSGAGAGACPAGSAVGMTDTAAIAFENHASTGSINGLSKNSSDVTVVGDTPGVSVPGPLSGTSMSMSGNGTFSGALSTLSLATTNGGTFGGAISAAGSSYAVTQDTKSKWYVPATTGEWTTIQTGLGISAPPTNAWGFQETSGTTSADFIGSETLTDNFGTSPTFAVAVPGWTRTATQTASSGASRMQRTSGAPNPSTTSIALLVYVSLPTGTVTGSGELLQWYTTGPRLSATTDPFAKASLGSNNATGTNNLGSAVHAFLLVSNVTTSTFTIYDELGDQLSPAWFADNTDLFYFGSISTTQANYLYAAQWTGSSAEFTATQAKQLLFRVTNPPSTFGGPVTVGGTLNVAGHRYATGTAPTVSSCGVSGTVQPKGDDGDAYFSTGTVSTSCTYTFAAAYQNKPACQIWPENATTLPTATVATDKITFTVDLASTTYHVHCVDPNR